MNEIKCIEQLFSLNITSAGHRQYTYDRDLTLECVEGVVARNNGVLEWQDPLKPDCGNNDGVWYLAIRMHEEIAEAGGDVFYTTEFCFDPSDKSFSIV